MNEGKWFALERRDDLPGDRPYGWPEQTRRMWKANIKGRIGSGIRKFFKATSKELMSFNPTPAIFVFFPQDCDMSGHLASIRKAWDNMQMRSYDCCLNNISMRTPGKYYGTGMVVIWTKYVLRKLAEVSPLFVPIWEDLKDMSAGDCGIYLADAPSRTWLESIQSAERRLFAEFREARDLDKIGLDLGKPPEAALQQHSRALSLLLEDKYEEGEALLEDMLDRWPDAWRAYWDLAMAAIRQGNPKKGYSVIRRAQKRYPASLNFDRLGADCCIELRDWALAEWHLKRLWGLNPWDPNLMLRYAGVAFSKGEYILSAKLYEDCMDCGSLNSAARSDYAVALYRIQRSREALAVLKELEKEDPQNTFVLNNIGFILASDGRPVEALHYCRRAVELDPDRESRWDSLGFAHLKLGNYPEATRAFLKAINLAPTFPDAWRHLLHAYQNGGKTDRLEGAKAYVGRVLPSELARFEREKGMDIIE